MGILDKACERQLPCLVSSSVTTKESFITLSSGRLQPSQQRQQPRHRVHLHPPLKTEADDRREESQRVQRHLQRHHESRR